MKRRGLDGGLTAQSYSAAQPGLAGKMKSWAVQSAAMPARPEAWHSNYRYLFFVFLRSAHVEPSNRLSDPPADSWEDWEGCVDLVLYLKPTAHTAFLIIAPDQLLKTVLDLTMIGTAVCRIGAPKIIAWSFLLLLEINILDSEGRCSGEESVHIFREEWCDVFCKTGTQYPGHTSQTPRYVEVLPFFLFIPLLPPLGVTITVIIRYEVSQFGDCWQAGLYSVYIQPY